MSLLSLARVAALPGGLDSAQLWIGVAILVALALLIAFVATRAARKKPPPGLPPPSIKVDVPAPGVGQVVPPREVQLPAERIAREGKARAEAEAAARALLDARVALETARDTAARDAAEVELSRKAHLAEEARRKLEYEQRKSGEAEDRLRRAAELAARAAAEAAARAEAEAQLRAQRATEEEARQQLVELQSGRTLSEGLAKTRGGFMARLNALLGTGKELDEAALGELEEILFSADVGVRTATALLESVRERLKRKELADISKVKGALREEIERILALGQVPGSSSATAGHGGLPELPPGIGAPQVVMVVGVNGTGKTTTVGKLAARLRLAGKKVLLGAGDTFRAAAGEQLDIWAERAQAPMVRGKDGSDPGAVLFDAVVRGKAEGKDVVLCDTAGRLHTKAGLMDELKRIKRTLEKAHAGSPHEVLLVVDATNGQNAIAQARQFHEALGVTGFVLTKLDGTAKGGVIIGICDELKIPVRYVGVGEKVADLKPFDPHEFVEALFE